MKITHINWHSHYLKPQITTRPLIAVIQTDLGTEIMPVKFLDMEGFPDGTFVAEDKLPIGGVIFWSDLNSNVEFPER